MQKELIQLDDATYLVPGPYSFFCRHDQPGSYNRFSLTK